MMIGQSIERIEDIITNENTSPTGKLIIGFNTYYTGSRYFSVNGETVFIYNENDWITTLINSVYVETQ